MGFFFLSVLHCLCTKSHTADHTLGKPVSAGPWPGQGKSWSNLDDGPALNVSLQRSFPTEMSLRWRHYTTWTGRSIAKAAWSWVDPGHSWGTRLLTGGTSPGRRCTISFGAVGTQKWVKKMTLHQWAWGLSGHSWKPQLEELAQGQAESKLAEAQTVPPFLPVPRSLL